MKQFVIFVCCVFFAFSCSDDAAWEKKLMQIKKVGDSNPAVALGCIDSLAESVKTQPEHIRMKYELLRVRVNDKADVMPDSDSDVKRLVEYFNRKGDDAERQEALYYAGSVYRDLQDTPRALEHFLQSMSVAERTERCDSILLRNTYSNLSYLFNRVQDNQNYLLYAQKEYEISMALHRLENTSIIHLATAYHQADSNRLAQRYFDEAFSREQERPKMEELYILLDYYALGGLLQQADRCMAMIDSLSPDSLGNRPSSAKLALGRYYQMKGDSRSAIGCYESILTNSSSLEEKYDASRKLISMYHDAGNAEKTSLFAVRFAQMCDTLNLGKRQEMAATVNNLYRYQRDKEKEQEILQAGERYRSWAISITVLALLAVVVVGWCYERKKNKLMQEVLSLSGEMNELKMEQEKLQEEVERQKLQNTALIRLLHQSGFASKADDIYNLLKRAAEGKYTMTAENWRQLYQVVDEESPGFREMVLQHLGEFTDQQMQVCYLLRIGMAKLDIQHITNLSRVTVWRWSKRYEWAEKGE